MSLTRQHVGVEDLTIEFPVTPYKGFGTESGFNALYFWSTAHCWVKNVAIINADMGVALDGTHFCTVSQAVPHMLRKGVIACQKSSCGGLCCLSAGCNALQLPAAQRCKSRAVLYSL